MPLTPGLIPGTEPPAPRQQRLGKFYDSDKEGYSAADIQACILPQPEYGINAPVYLGTLAMLSISSHRDKFPVSSCARVGPRGFTAGHRTIAGTLAFHTIDREAFTKLTAAARYHWRVPDTILADEFPSFDIVITMVNESGDASYASIAGLTILDEGVTYSMDNVALMESYSYMAKSRTPLQPVLDNRGVPTSTLADDYTKSNDGLLKPRWESIQSTDARKALYSQFYRTEPVTVR